MINVPSPGIGTGTKVELSAEGDQEKDAVEALVALIDNGFGE